VPWYTETRLIYYRKDLAEKAGVTPEEGWSQDDLKAFTKAMQDKGGAKWGISLQPGGQGSWQTYMPFAWQRGAELVDGEEFTFNTPPMQEALDYYASFFEEKISPTDLAQGALETGFINGDIGAFVSGPWHMGILGDAAWKFVDFLTQDAQQQKLYELVGSLPAVQSTWESGELSTDPLLKAFGDQLQDAKSSPAIETWEQVAAPLDDAIEQVSRGQSDPETALSAAEEKANGIGFGS
jgi:multiple sugar transport system substrate-binding protein